MKRAVPLDLKCPYCAQTRKTWEGMRYHIRSGHPAANSPKRVPFNRDPLPSPL